MDFRYYPVAPFGSKPVIMPRVGRGEGEEQGQGVRKDTYLHYLEQRSMGRLRRGAGDRINRSLALDMLNPPPRCVTTVWFITATEPQIQLKICDSAQFM